MMNPWLLTPRRVRKFRLGEWRVGGSKSPPWFGGSSGKLKDPSTQGTLRNTGDFKSSRIQFSR